MIACVADADEAGDYDPTEDAETGAESKYEPPTGQEAPMEHSRSVPTTASTSAFSTSAPIPRSCFRLTEPLTAYTRYIYIYIGSGRTPRSLRGCGASSTVARLKSFLSGSRVTLLSSTCGQRTDAGPSGGHTNTSRCEKRAGQRIKGTAHASLPPPPPLDALRTIYPSPIYSTHSEP